MSRLKPPNDTRPRIIYECKACQNPMADAYGFYHAEYLICAICKAKVPAKVVLPPGPLRTKAGYPNDGMSDAGVPLQPMQPADRGEIHRPRPLVHVEGETA